jgi:hypothetical protein
MTAPPPTDKTDADLVEEAICTAESIRSEWRGLLEEDTATQLDALASRIQSLSAEVERLRTELKPLAKRADQIDASDERVGARTPDEQYLQEIGAGDFRVGDLRRARAALSDKGTETPTHSSGTTTPETAGYVGTRSEPRSGSDSRGDDYTDSRLETAVSDLRAIIQRANLGVHILSAIQRDRAIASNPPLADTPIRATGEMVRAARHAYEITDDDDPSRDKPMEAAIDAALGLSGKEPDALFFTTREGGQWLPWSTRHSWLIADRKPLHAIKFADGSIFDVLNGWRSPTAPVQPGTKDK